MEDITVLYTYYGQRHMIPLIQKQELKTVIIDDGSPEPLGPVENIDVYRIEENIPWNQPGARNLGFHVCEGWILNSDIDHVITFENVMELEKLDLNKGVIYFLNRRKPTGEYVGGVSVFLIHKDLYEKIGGWDEDFSGHYGWDDRLFMVYAKKHGSFTNLDNVVAIDYSDTASTDGERDTEYNWDLFNNKNDLNRNETPRLRFNWHKVH